MEWSYTMMTTCSYGESKAVLMKYDEKNSTYKWEPSARFEHIDKYKITTNYL
jgi:hypothetical protein